MSSATTAPPASSLPQLPPPAVTHHTTRLLSPPSSVTTPSPPALPNHRLLLAHPNPHGMKVSQCNYKEPSSSISNVIGRFFKKTYILTIAIKGNNICVSSLCQQVSYKQNVYEDFLYITLYIWHQLSTAHAETTSSSSYFLSHRTSEVAILKLWVRFHSPKKILVP